MNAKEVDNTCFNETFDLPYPSNLKATLYNKDTLMIITWNNMCNSVLYNLEINGQIIQNVVCPYVFTTNPNTVYKIRIKSVCPYAFSPWSSMLTILTSGEIIENKSDRLLIGYWQNTEYKLCPGEFRDIPDEFDIINVAFATPKEDCATLNFTPYNSTKEEFIKDIDYLQDKNKKICISIGGSNEIIKLKTQDDEDKFVKSLENIIYDYGFNGLDIHLENGIQLESGDLDFKNPTTPTIIHLINAIKRIIKIFGNDFILTMAAETVYVQGGFSAYGSIWGAYLPIIYALRDELTIINIKNYNSGLMLALDGNSYPPGNLDFEVSMCEMLINGFPILNNSKNIFPGIDESKVGVGLLAYPNIEEDGYSLPIEGEISLNYLILGESFGGNYILRKSNGYKNFKGIMIWSINTDSFNGYSFSRNYRDYLNSLPNIT